MFQPPSFRDIPRLDEPAKIVGATLLVALECNECRNGTTLCLVNAQPVVCQGCGATFRMDSLAWDAKHPTPKIALSATPSMAKQLTS